MNRLLWRDRRLAGALALADFRYEKRVSACLVLVLVAVQTPLLLLFGLRSGVLSGFREDLRRNPSSLQLIPLNQSRHARPFFRELRRAPEVGFLIPNTRMLAATVALRKSDSDTTTVDAEMIPTRAGDPLLDGVTPPRRRSSLIVLSRSTAEKLDVQAGDTVMGRWSRIVGEQREAALVPLTVASVLDAALYQRDAIFVPLSLLKKAENYREGFAVPAFQAVGAPRPDGSRSFASFRLYARTIDDVQVLRDRLAALGIDTDTRLSEIRLVQKLDTALTGLFSIVASLGALGFALSLAVSLWGNTERKRYELAVLRLMGLKGSALAMFPIAQGLTTAILGSLLSTALCLLVAPGINHLFADGVLGDRLLCRVLPGDVLGAWSVTAVLAACAASTAGWYASQLNPAEGLRRE